MSEASHAKSRPVPGGALVECEAPVKDIEREFEGDVIRVSGLRV